MTPKELVEHIRAIYDLGEAHKRDVFKRRRSPILDPITAAMLGYTRRGTGWVKKNAASTTQEAMK